MPTAPRRLSVLRRLAAGLLALGLAASGGALPAQAPPAPAPLPAGGAVVTSGRGYAVEAIITAAMVAAALFAVCRASRRN